MSITRPLQLYLFSLIFLIPYSYLYLDIPIARYFIENKEHYEALGDLISIGGESHWYIGTAIIGYLFFRYYKPNEVLKMRFLTLLYVNLFSGLVSLLLKHIFGRMRPWGLRDNGDEYGFLLFGNFDAGFMEKFKIHFATLAEAPTTFTSFPSGHTTTLFAVATYLSLLFPKRMWLWIVLAALCASARLLDSDHFLSDLLAGTAIGTLSTLYIYSKMRSKL